MTVQSMFSMNRRVGVMALLAGPLLLPLIDSQHVRADERPFTFVYDASVQPAGHGEYEQWVTWTSHKDSDHAFSRFEFAHEF